jgi:hypothetical protein
MAQAQNLAPARLADQLERAFRGGAWHGPALMELLSGVDAALAARRPIPSGHAIGEIVAHLAYWLEDTRRQILDEARIPGGPGSDWGAPPASEAAWLALCAALEEAHCGLRAAVLQLDPKRLDEARPGSDTTLRGLLTGILQHNAYHGGQIALLRKRAESPAGGLP